MPKRTDIHKILIIGSGPIVIGQACEFDYSGTQACKALKQEGFEVVLVNSNPATIMTDPELADKTYVEPLTVDAVSAIIERERPDALLPTVGGQTALNLTVKLAEAGVLEKYGVELIGAKLNAIHVAENRQLFKQAMDEIGLLMPKARFCHTMQEAIAAAEEIDFPIIIRPAFTLGGTGGGIAYNMEEFEEIAERGLTASPISEIQVEESIMGWKEYELEVMRDLADNVVIICSIENFDPDGRAYRRTITVAPAQTLTDREYQMMRDAALKIIRKNRRRNGWFQHSIRAVIRTTEARQLRIIEMNPRVSRSSALASKGNRLSDCQDCSCWRSATRSMKSRMTSRRKRLPRLSRRLIMSSSRFRKWAFEKFPGADATLGTQMKSVGEAMAIGRTFKGEAFLERACARSKVRKSAERARRG
ncbi:MAG: hypothetical protein U0Y68_24390 [Blastocatellia bacterium]